MSAFELPLHFLRPWWWLALAPLPLALWMLARNSSGRAGLAKLADATLLPYLISNTGARRRLAMALVASAWLLAVAALSGPAWQKVAAPLYVNGAARVVVLSLSDDMLAQDMQPDRMTRARFAVRDLLNDAGDARMALVAYAGAAFTVAPLTDDKNTILNLLQALKPDVMPVPGNDAAAGVRQGVELLQQAHAKGGEIVLVTDTADAAAVAQAKAARAQGIRVDVLGVGTREGAPVPRAGGGFANGRNGTLMARRGDASLEAVANAGGGRYVVLQADGTGAAAFGAPVAEAGHASRAERAQLWRDGGIWLLPVLVVLAALAFRRGWMLVLALLVLPIGMPAAHAASWDSLWTNRDQRALRALQQGNVAQARKLASTPDVRGAVDYRAGDYARAAKAFAQGDDARSHYNLGNALAKQGEYEEAVTAYQQALQRDPKMADARANLNAVEDWLKKHQQSPQSGQQGNNKKGDQHGQPSSSADVGSSSPDTGKQSEKFGTQQGAASSTPQASSTSGANAAGKQGAQQQGNTGMAQQDHDTTSAEEAARQQQQAQQAEHALSREMRQARNAARSGEKGDTNSFALGQAQAKQDGRFSPQERAMLHAVPDDPGALLRRKFRLEWDQRNGRQQEDGQQ
ncbi:MAG TPA: VWA domain-containing protein [Rhodanobacteraceae bacterium]|nr:VWA domain-containing protein [Rhodanobacteraceae bacterium]